MGVSDVYFIVFVFRQTQDGFEEAYQEINVPLVGEKQTENDVTFNRQDFSITHIVQYAVCLGELQRETAVFTR